ncbi:MAG: ribonuclease P protein component 1 [Candidatus Nanohaloarchaea archaeon]|nr:ribonuclease P protein component 1 [Candidatus Nanohaloarchaea archaeon]
MPRTPDNLPRHELIGLEAEVVEATDPSREGITGTVVDETKNTLVLDTDQGERQIPKEESVFRFHLGDLKVRVNGRLLAGRPEERIGKDLPGKWGYVA